MEELDLKNNAMILFDSYLEDGRKLLESLRKIGVDCPAAAIDDDGFLPDGVESVYGSFLGEYEKSEEIPGRPRYFNEVKVPDYWEIRFMISTDYGARSSIRSLRIRGW